MEKKINELIINNAKKLLYSYLEENADDIYKGWIFVYNHSLRVDSYVQKLCDLLSNISQEDILIARLSAVFHDIGYLKGKNNHAFEGSKMFLELSKKTDLFNDINTSQIAENIKNHSDKDVFDENITTKLLKDADILDQIGAMSILMICKNYNYSDSKFFEDILTHLEIKEIDYCSRQGKKLQLKESKELLDEKVKFIKTFSSQLRDELSGEIE